MKQAGAVGFALKPIDALRRRHNAGTQGHSASGSDLKVVRRAFVSSVKIGSFRFMAAPFEPHKSRVCAYLWQVYNRRQAGG